MHEKEEASSDAGLVTLSKAHVSAERFSSHLLFKTSQQIGVTCATWPSWSCRAAAYACKLHFLGQCFLQMPTCPGLLGHFPIVSLWGFPLNAVMCLMFHLSTNFAASEFSSISHINVPIRESLDRLAFPVTGCEGRMTTQCKHSSIM